MLLLLNLRMNKAAKKAVRILTILGLIIIFNPTTSLSQYWKLNKIDNDQGLSNSAVTSIFLDSKQYMWFGTWDGLNKYDGQDISVFKPNDLAKMSIGNNIIREIFEDTSNGLWIVTDKNINLFDGTTGQFQVYLNSHDNAQDRERIIRSSMSSDSILWCSIYDMGISYYSAKNNEFELIKGDKSIETTLKEVVGLKAFSEQRLSLLTESGNLITLIKEDQWTPVRIDSLSATLELITNQHWFIDFDDKSILFIAIEGGGLLYVDIINGTSKIIESGNSDFIITEISKNVNNEFLWLGTDNGKILQLFTDKELSIKNLDYLFPELSGAKVKILKIYETYPDLLWIGTDGNGIHEYTTQGTPFSSVRKGDIKKGELSHNIVRAIYGDPISGDMIIGTRGGGLNIINLNSSSTKLITTKDGLSNNAVLSIEGDKDHNYWIGLDSEGVDFIEKESGKILHFPDDFMNQVDLSFKSVYAICIDSYENIWLGTSGYGIIKLSISKKGTGKYFLDNYEQFQSNSTQKNTLKSNIVYSIIEDRPNFLWIGSRGGGVQILNSITSEFLDINAKIDQDVISLYKSTDYKELWVGTSRGLFRVSLQDKNYDLDIYNEGSGLPNNTIHAVQEDDLGNIWISTNNGLINWNRELNRFRNYTKNDGLASNEYADGASFYNKSTKRVLFGGILGLTIIEPKKVKISDYFPRLAFQELKLFNKLITPSSPTKLLHSHIDETDTILFENDQNFFSISFTALNYINNQKSQYAYFLEGFDKDWNKIGTERTAYFTNVPPGDYSLKIKCSNQDGLWNEEYRSLSIIVKPPIWKTLIAYFMYTASFLLLVAILYFYLKRKSAEKKKLFFGEVEKRNIEEINNYKLQFFTNVSHEFRTPLSLILLPANKLFENRDKYPELKSYFENIYYNANRLLKLIGELIEFRKAESDHVNLMVSKGDISWFTEQITKAFSSLAKEHNVSISFETDVNDSVQVWFDHDKIKTIMLNLISNAIKYNRPDGVVIVSVSLENGEALIKVEDTGIGIPENFLDEIFQRFFNITSDSQTKVDAYNSSGIGLALTKSLVESHKGTIDVTSNQGEGSVFYIKFPINKESYTDFLVDSIVQPDSLVIEHNIDSEFVNHNINKTGSHLVKKELETRHCLLIVDDNDQFRTIITEMFKGDYEIVEATNGAEAIDLIKENSVDLIISDVLMPEINGYELCKLVKDDINTCHIPVILLTAMGEIENRIKGIDIGADSYIPKPFHPKHLIARVEKLIESQETIRESIKKAPWKLADNVNGLAQKDKVWLNKMIAFIVNNMSNTHLDSNLLMDEFAMSKTQLYRKVKAITAYTPHGFIKKYRLSKAADLLKDSDKTISEVAYETGFNNRSYFYRSFKEEYNCSPSDFKSKAC
jgi:signal transduction histidine kinase/ligand-binding sensor domain-containing protein/AraC-like DNA-binding protein